jgi:hypothetical protein
MSIAPRTKFKRHLYMPGQTVTAAIKLANRHDVTKEEMPGLLLQYKEANGAENPKPGMSVVIPILPRHEAEVFKK